MTAVKLDIPVITAKPISTSKHKEQTHESKTDNPPAQLGQPSPSNKPLMSLGQRVRKFSTFCGPGYMIAVGYMDPGNWATDIEAGSRYGYALLWIILLSNIMAMLLQHLCVRLGMTTRMDLAENCRANCPTMLNWFLYIIAELAIISCDLAEVIGTAIALNLLFGIPILWGVLITVADVLLILTGLSKSHKTLEMMVIVLMTVIGLCFAIELAIVKPSWKQVLLGFIPRDPTLFVQRDALFSALGIIGATVMPHNLYLHSSIVKTRISEQEEKRQEDINYASADSMVALVFALCINAAILIVAAASFHSRGHHDVQHIQDASALMKEWMGPMAAWLFGLALLAAGQSSTVTGTLAGQIVFEGFLKLQMKPWIRRLVTRLVAIVPALLIIGIAGSESINQLLLYSQVVLSFQLPFAIIPLIVFTFKAESKQGLGETLLRTSSWIVAIIIIMLNIMYTITLFR